MRNPKAIAALLASLTMAASCGKTTQKIGAQDPAREGSFVTKPDQTPTDDPNAGGAAGGLDPNAVKSNHLLEMVMHIKAGAAFIDKACEGDLGIQVNLQVGKNDPNFKMITVPKDTVECILMGKIGLKELIEGGDTAGKTPPQIDDQFKTEKDVIGFRLLAAGVYSPRRPFLPAFFSADKDDLKHINVSRSLQVKNWISGESASGTTSVRTLRYTKSMRVDSLGRSFKDVYDFEFHNDGFDGSNRLNLFLFDRMMLRVALKPFALLKMELNTTVSEVMASAGDKLKGTGLDGLTTGPIGGLTSLIGKLITVNISADAIKIKDLPKEGDEKDDDDGIVTSRDSGETDDSDETALRDDGFSLDDIHPAGDP
jgi:hypothetical protein